MALAPRAPRVALVTGSGGSQRLPRLIGARRVAEHMRTEDAAAGLRAFRERCRRKETS